MEMNTFEEWCKNNNRHDLLQEILPVGTKYGCLTIIGDFSVYQKEFAEKEIKKLQQERNEFLQGKKNPHSNIDTVDFYDDWIKVYKNREYYQCKCKCGLISYLNKFQFLEKKHRFCGNECKLRKQQQDKRIKKIWEEGKRVKEPDYDKTLPFTIHDTLEILAVKEKEEIRDVNKRGNKGYVFQYKVYKCRCNLCNQIKYFRYSAFAIKLENYIGYSSIAHCNCHQISSFQWRTIDIFRKHNVKYEAETSYEELLGVGQQNYLKYDYTVFDEQNNIKCFVECQGEQHYKAIESFGGEKALQKQQANDELKRQFAKQHSIPLIEIPYTCNSYEKEEEYLHKMGII